MDHKKSQPTGRDRISALPEPVVHHILSFLPNNDVKVTSSLSKTWYHISNSFPFLDFENIWPVTGYFEFEPNEYLNYIDETLHRFHNHNELNLEIKRLTLPITFTPSLPKLLDSWISLVLQCGVHELNLKIGDHHDGRGPCYNLPLPVLADESIRVANLAGCSLLRTFPNNHHISGSRSNLLKLCLYNVLLDDVILRSIMSTCPLIEDLAILSCIGMKYFHISNLRKLKTLKISRNSSAEMVEIDVPSLQSLKIQGSVKIRVGECPKLIDLDLYDVILEDFRLQDFLSKLSFLCRLRLTNLSSLTKLKMSSDTLNKLTIVGCDSLVELKIDARNLCLLKSNLFYLDSTSKYTSYMLCEWHGSYPTVNPLTIEDFFVAVRNFVSKASHLEKLNLRLYSIHQPISFEDLNKRAVQPVINIDHLDLFMNNLDVSEEMSYPDLLDCVLWSCHPRNISLRGPIDDSMMSLCEVIGHPHQPSKLSRSWLHYLEEVRYVAGDGSESQLPMDGISFPCLHILFRDIKFVFKW